MNRSFLSVFFRFNARMFTNVLWFKDRQPWEVPLQLSFLLFSLLLIFSLGASWPHSPFWPVVALIALEVIGSILAWRAPH